MKNVGFFFFLYVVFVECVELVGSLCFVSFGRLWLRKALSVLIRGTIYLSCGLILLSVHNHFVVEMGD